MTMKNIYLALMAMRINFYEEVVGSVQQRKQWFSLENEKIKPF